MLRSILLIILLLPLTLFAAKVAPTNTPPAGNILPIANIARATHVPEKTLMNHEGKISFYFQDIEVRVLLELLAKSSGMNFIISDAVKGNTTLNLKDVSWRQALEIILQSQGLAYRQIGQALLISTADEILRIETRQLQNQQDLANLSPLYSRIIHLRYAEPSMIGSILKGESSGLLTARGEYAIDTRTNSIIIRDVKANVQELTRYIHQIDVPAKQVSIEARIVNMDSRYESQLGVRFGISNSRSLSGTFSRASKSASGIPISDYLDNIPIGGAASPVDRLNFNIPASTLSTGTTPASIGLALARLGPILLDMELSALEEEGHTQIISKPHIVTSNQQKAVIQTGEEIPYQQATSSGATAVDFKKAVLSLEIIPQITQDNKVILRLKATQNTRGEQLLVQNGDTPANFGPPTINTQGIESYVTLNNNETVVVGGVYKITKTNVFDRVPFFSDIPLIGNLFKHKGIKNQKTELLIFLTPKIITAQDNRLAYKD